MLPSTEAQPNRNQVLWKSLAYRPPLRRSVVSFWSLHSLKRTQNRIINLLSPSYQPPASSPECNLLQSWTGGGKCCRRWTASFWAGRALQRCDWSQPSARDPSARKGGDVVSWWLMLCFRKWINKQLLAWPGTSVYCTCKKRSWRITAEHVPQFFVSSVTTGENHQHLTHGFLLCFGISFHLL